MHQAKERLLDHLCFAVNVTVDGEALASERIFTLAVRIPGLVGAKEMVKLQLAPVVSDPVHVSQPTI